MESDSTMPPEPPPLDDDALDDEPRADVFTADEAKNGALGLEHTAKPGCPACAAMRPRHLRAIDGGGSGGPIPPPVPNFMRQLSPEEIRKQLNAEMDDECRSLWKLALTAAISNGKNPGEAEHAANEAVASFRRSFEPPTALVIMPPRRFP